MATSTRSPQARFLSLVCLAPTLPTAAAEVISTQAPALRPILGENPHLDGRLRHTLVRDKRADVRAGALTHSTDPALLTSAATAGSVSERAAAAGNPATPGDVLAQMAEDAEANIARHLIVNPALPPAAAVGLAKKFHVGNLWGANRSLGSTQGSAAWRSPGVGAALHAHPQIAWHWRDDPEPTTGRVIAYSPNIDHKTAVWLAKNRRSRTVQLALAMNPFVSEEVCDLLTSGAREARAGLRRTLSGRGDVAAVARTLLATPQGRRYLVAAESRTLDWLLAVHPDLEEETALALAARRFGQTVEPYVMITLVNRFGAAAAAATADAQSPSRLRATTPWSPLLRMVEAAKIARVEGLLADPVGAADLAARLASDVGEDRDAWKIIVSVLLHSGPEFSA